MNPRLDFTHSITVQADPQRVWTALTDPNERNNYVCTSNQTDLRAGGAFIEEFQYGPTRAGIFLVVNEPRRLVQENFVFDRGVSHRYYNSFSLVEVEDGTLVTIDVEGFGDNESEDWLRESMDVGWHTELRILKEYVETGRDMRPKAWKGVRMGIRFVTDRARGDAGGCGRGVRVIDVIGGTPAEAAGIDVGDVIVAVDDESVADFVQFRREISKYSPGDLVKFTVCRNDGGSVERHITLGDATA